MRRCRLCLILSTIVILSGVLAGQRQPQLSGPAAPAELQVRVAYADDRSSEESLRVELLNGPGTFIAQAFTSEGHASFRNLSPGTYRLKVSGIEVEDVTTDSFTISRGESLHIEYVVVQKRDSAGTGAPRSSSAMVAAIDLNVPGKAKKEFDKGVEALNRNEWPEARRKFERAAELYPQYALAYNNLGVALMNLGERQLGREAFEKAVNLDSHLANGYLNLARIASADKKYGDAEIFLGKTLSIDPMNAVALLLLANVQLQNGKFDECIANARRMHSLPQEHYAVIHYFAARAFEAKGVPTEAVAEYKVLLRESPNGPTADKARAALAELQKQSQKH